MRLLALAIVVAVVACGRGAGDAAREALPVAASTPSSPEAARAGAATCAECHAAQSAAWSRSTHGRAGGSPTPDRVIAPFDGTPIRFRDATVTPNVTAGVYGFTVRRAGERDTTLRVDAVIGGGHMQGGGTQAFVTRWIDGTMRLLPFDFSRQARRWFCNSGAGHGWIPIADTMPLAACADWPPNRVVGDEPRFTNCQGCHGSALTVTLDTATAMWRTSYATLAIDCESCHGPADAHVRAARAGRAATSPMPSLARQDKAASVHTCLTCHAVKARLAANRYSVALAVLGDSLLQPDGRTRTFAYQEGHLWSDCYVNGPMTCTSCHDPHTQGYRDIAGRALRGRDDDGQCTDCHASEAAAPAAHAKHPAGTPGARCVACHMPYVQQAAVGERVPYGRADHTIAIPRPAFDASLGVPNACAACHAKRTTMQLEADVQRLWGPLKAHPAPVTALAHAATFGDASAAARALLDTTTRHAAAQHAALAEYVTRWLAPDAAIESDTERRLRALARSPDLDVRALALAALHYAGGERGSVRSFLAEQLRAERDGDGLRARWAIALGTLGDRARTRGDAPQAVHALERALEVRPNDARLHAGLGLALAASGDARGAAAHYRAALAVDPVQPLTLVNLGVALEAAGDTSGAADSYRRAIALDAHEPMALTNLGNVMLRAGRLDDAARLYERAVAADPSLAPAHFALAQARGQRGDYPGALAALRRGLVFDSTDANVRALAAELARRLGGR